MESANKRTTWARKYEEGSLNTDVPMTGLVRDCEKPIAALEQLVGQQTLEIEFLKGALKLPSLPKTGLSCSSPALWPQHLERLPADGTCTLDTLWSARASVATAITGSVQHFTIRD